MSKLPPPHTIGGLPVTPLSNAQWAQYMLATCRAQPARPTTVFSANGQVLALCATRPAFKKLMHACTAINADGQPLVLASRWLTSTPLPGRAATTDMFHHAASVAQQHGLRFFFLGGKQQQLQQALEAIQQQYPQLIIAGSHHGYFGRAEEADLCTQITQAKTDVLWVGLGVPLQQEFMMRNLGNLQGVSWVKTCGGLFDYFTPTVRRAPIWMQRAGLEWLYRMWQNPRRYAWRYATTNLIALWVLLTQTRSARA